MCPTSDNTSALEGFEPFVGAVRRFVSLIESEGEGRSAKAYLLALNANMLEVATHGMLLDYAYIDRNDFDPDPYFVGNDEEARRKTQLEQGLSPLLQDALLEHAGDELEHARVDLFSNDVIELYGDLARGLRLWDVGSVDARGEACWQWAFQKWHWHDHLYRAMHGAILIRFADDETGMTEKSS